MSQALHATAATRGPKLIERLINSSRRLASSQERGLPNGCRRLRHCFGSLIEPFAALSFLRRGFGSLNEPFARLNAFRRPFGSLSEPFAGLGRLRLRRVGRGRPLVPLSDDRPSSIAWLYMHGGFLCHLFHFLSLGAYTVTLLLSYPQVRLVYAVALRTSTTLNLRWARGVPGYAILAQSWLVRR